MPRLSPKRQMTLIAETIQSENPMADEWQVVKVEGSWGTEYYIQDVATGHTYRNPDGSTFRSVSGHTAERVCKEANKEAKEK